jgi:hypothetical protein
VDCRDTLGRSRSCRVRIQSGNGQQLIDGPGSVEDDVFGVIRARPKGDAWGAQLQCRVDRTRPGFEQDSGATGGIGHDAVEFGVASPFGVFCIAERVLELPRGAIQSFVLLELAVARPRIDDPKGIRAHSVRALTQHPFIRDRRARDTGIGFMDDFDHLRVHS